MKIPEFPNNQTIIDEYMHYMELQNLKKVTQRNKAVNLFVFCKFFNHKELGSISKKDIETFYIALKAKAENEELNFSTFQKYIIELRSFFNWFKPDNDFFKNVQIPNTPKDTSEQDYINADDIKKMMSFATDSRDRALVMLLWNTAMRVGELSNIKVKDVDLVGEKVTVTGKTGKRDIPITSALPDLRNWLNIYKGKSQEPLFPNKNNRNEPLGVRGIQYVVRDLVEKAGISNKHINAHSFRHGRLTELAGLGVTEMQLRLYAGWSKSSLMVETYINTKQAEVYDKIREVDGLVRPKQKPKPKDQLKPIECYNCHTENPFDAKYCLNCSVILDDKFAIQKQEAEKIAQEQHDAELIKRAHIEFIESLNEAFKNPAKTLRKMREDYQKKNGT
jgi:site-specific recombinase XerD